MEILADYQLMRPLFKLIDTANISQLVSAIMAKLQSI